jgi:hypothetical protein
MQFSAPRQFNFYIETTQRVNEYDGAIKICRWDLVSKL